MKKYENKRLSATYRKEIINHIVDRKLRKKEKRLEEAKNRAGLSICRAVIGEQFFTETEGLPGNWFRKISGVRVGSSYNPVFDFTTTETMRCPAHFIPYSSPRLRFSKEDFYQKCPAKKGIILDRYLKLENCFEDEKLDLTRELSKIILPANTVYQLLETWPEAVNWFDFPLRSIEENLPAVKTDNLNKLLEA